MQLVHASRNLAHHFVAELRLCLFGLEQILEREWLVLKYQAYGRVLVDLDVDEFVDVFVWLYAPQVTDLARQRGRQPIIAVSVGHHDVHDSLRVRLPVQQGDGLEQFAFRAAFN
jgi:hypothetical protein